jgi:SAM-dependent methyltransferase
LVQTEDYAGREALFNEDYAYFSSFSSSWLNHAQAYVAAMVERFELGSESLVVEVAANDGYLLQYVRELGIPCYGVEPTTSTAAAARTKGIKVIEDFFGVSLAERLRESRGSVDLLVANNVLAHVPDINDFVRGFARLLKPQGVATFEFPHLLRLVQEVQFDTIYHEHYSYLSLTAVKGIFEANGLAVFDVEELTTHGGSLRVFAQLRELGCHSLSHRVEEVLQQEEEAGLLTVEGYGSFQGKADTIKNDLLRFLLQAKQEGKVVVGYGAAAKGNTLLNYSGVRPDLMRFVVDRNPAKQGKFMPGSRIPIVTEDWLKQDKPDYVVILPWNLSGEIKKQIRYVHEWEGQMVTSIPQLEINV